MPRTRLYPLLAVALFTLAAPALAAGRAEVRYADPGRFTDAGFGAVEIERTQRLLTAHIEGLAQRLPAGQVLRVTVQDIDLAGELDTFGFDRLRVLGRLPDRPRLAFQYELRAGDRLIDAGQAELTDLAYLQHGVGRRKVEPLPYEKRLLDKWFAQQVAPKAAAVR